MSFSDSVWERTANSHALSKNTFVGLLTFWTALGIAATGVTAYLCQDLQVGWLLVLGVLAVSIGGILLALMSDNPLLSFIGYMMVTIPFGALLGPLVAMYSVGTVVKVTAITTAMVVVLGIVGAIYPRSLESWSSFLFGGLLILLLGMFALPLLGWAGVDVSTAMTVWDWVGVILFSAFVIFDLNRAMRLERTVDNSIDCAIAVYLDWVNLFIRLLRLLGGNSSD